MKITISIDDENPYIKGAFGEGAILKLAESFNYKAEIQRPKDELPEQETEPGLDPLTGEPIEVFIPHPRDVLMMKNPESPEDFVARLVIEKGVKPILLESSRKAIRAEALAQTDTQTRKLEGAIGNASEVIKD